MSINPAKLETYRTAEVPHDERQTCPFCMRKIKVKNGVLVRHGWNAIGVSFDHPGAGYHTAPCAGTGRQAIEYTDADAIDALAAWSQRYHNAVKELTMHTEGRAVGYWQPVAFISHRTTTTQVESMLELARKLATVGGIDSANAVYRRDYSTKKEMSEHGGKAAIYVKTGKLATLGEMPEHYRVGYDLEARNRMWSRACLWQHDDRFEFRSDGRVRVAFSKTYETLQRRAIGRAESVVKEIKVATQDLIDAINVERKRHGVERLISSIEKYTP